jgi:hypothetical protein
MKKIALLMLLLGSVSSPVMAKPHHSYYPSRSFSHRDGPRDYESRRYAYRHDGYRHRSDQSTVQQTHSHVTCDMVRRSPQGRCRRQRPSACHWGA